VRAAADDVFAAWADPAEIAQWMTPSGTAAAAVFGWSWQINICPSSNTGQYQVIQPPELLAFTWRSEFTGMRDTLVTLRLTELGSRETQTEVTHEFATDAETASHAGGWGQMLDRAHLEDR
jgi:uncharacterized protein YndB with AHSA1/START domain